MAGTVIITGANGSLAILKATMRRNKDSYGLRAWNGHVLLKIRQR